MEALHLPNNIKVHYAGSEVMTQYVALYECGVNYALYTAFPFVSRDFFKKKISPIMPMKWMEKPEIEIPRHLYENNLHVIQDSGLFTLMFGSQKNNVTANSIYKWYDLLIDFTLNHQQPVTCVEVDCQKILGTQEAWNFRNRMREDLPNNRIINVFHLEDGKYGLDRLIEFSDYIAISVPELRFANKHMYVKPLAEYIKNKKPSIDIHLLGCTHIKTISDCSFCTSCDSTTWTFPRRCGTISDIHISKIKTESVKNLVGEKSWNTCRLYMNEVYTNATILNVEILKRVYEKSVGSQDYKL